VIKAQADSDYTSLLMTENQFVLHNKLDAVEKRNEVEKMIRVVGQQRANDRLLDALNNGVVKLRLTHQALAAAAQGNNPGSLKENIAELQAAGKAPSHVPLRTRLNAAQFERVAPPDGVDPLLQGGCCHWSGAAGVRPRSRRRSAPSCWR